MTSFMASTVFRSPWYQARLPRVHWGDSATFPTLKAPDSLCLLGACPPRLPLIPSWKDPRTNLNNRYLMRDSFKAKCEVRKAISVRCRRGRLPTYQYVHDRRCVHIHVASNQRTLLVPITYIRCFADPRDLPTLLQCPHPRSFRANTGRFK